MISIQEKINVFRQELLLNVNKQREREITHAKEKVEEKIKVSQDLLDIEINKIQDRYQRLESRNVSKIVSEGKNKSRDLTLKIRNQISSDFFETVLEEAYKFLDSKEYRDYFVTSLKELKGDLDDTKSIIFQITDSDKKRFGKDITETLKDIDIQFETLDPEDIGGFIVYDDKKTYRFDFSLLNFFNENKQQIEYLLFKEMENNIE